MTYLDFYWSSWSSGDGLRGVPGLALANDSGGFGAPAVVQSPSVVKTHGNVVLVALAVQVVQPYLR